jgi:hypothetical protein
MPPREDLKYMQRLDGWLWGAAMCAGLVGGCRDAVTTDAGVDPGDVGSVTTDLGSDVPTSPRDAAVDVGTSPVDAGRDASTTPRDGGSATLTMAALTNPADPAHPGPAAVVTLSDTTLVALSPRIFVSGPSTSGACSFAVWIGTSAGGDFSAVQAFESLPAGMGDGGSPDCFARSVVGTIPVDIAIGDTIGMLRGKVEFYCPRGATCPAGTALELGVGASVGGAVAVSGHGGTVPAPTVVHVGDINGTGTTLAPRDLALQNGLVRITGALVRTAPSAANHDGLVIADMAGAGAPGITVVIGKYRGVTCQRDVLGTAAPGSSVGAVTGILEYAFGSWEIQPRQESDLPGVVCAGGDAGVADAGASVDAHGD